MSCLIRSYLELWNVNPQWLSKSIGKISLMVMVITRKSFFNTFWQPMRILPFYLIGEINPVFAMSTINVQFFKKSFEISLDYQINKTLHKMSQKANWFFILLNSSRKSSVTYPIFEVIKQFIMLNLHHHKITFFFRKNGKLVLHTA